MLAPRTENGDELLGELPGASGDHKVEIWKRRSEAGTCTVEMVEHKWGTGLGWYVHKRLTLDAAQWDMLTALLAPGVLTAPRLRGSSPSVVREENVVRLLFAS